MVKNVLAVLLCVGFAFASVVARADSANPPQDQGTLLKVYGTATIERKPDTATLLLKVETNNDSADIASSKNAAILRTILDKLSALGVPKEQFKGDEYTAEFVPHPQAGVASAYRQELYGYVVLREFEVEGVNVSVLPAAIDAVLAAGATSVTPDHYALSDEAALEAQATDLALKDARRKADQIAVATGRQVAGISAIELYQQPRTIGRVSARSGREVDVKPSTELNPQAIAVSQSVDVTFILR